jgi:hypothetical protein
MTWLSPGEGYKRPTHVCFCWVMQSSWLHTCACSCQHPPVTSAHSHRSSSMQTNFMSTPGSTICSTAFGKLCATPHHSTPHKYKASSTGLLTGTITPSGNRSMGNLRASCTGPALLPMASMAVRGVSAVSIEGATPAAATTSPRLQTAHRTPQHQGVRHCWIWS